jgi:hypothetical protein
MSKENAMNRSSWAVVSAAVLVLCGQVGAADDRIAFEESFDSAEGWEVVRGAPIKSITAEDGNVRFETVRGALNSAMTQPWPDWPEDPYKSNTTLHKSYDVEVDFDKYHYVVVNLVERGTAVTLHISGRGSPVLYTTGLRAFDLRNCGLEGKHKVTLHLELLNTSGVATLDFVRLVSELTDEEKKVLMRPPLDFPQEDRQAHAYHRLEAANARAGRVIHRKYQGQLLAYRDTLSNGLVFRLTDQDGDQGFRGGDTTLAFDSTGRYFTISGGRDGRNVWDFAEVRWRETLGGANSEVAVPDYAASWESRENPDIIYGYRTQGIDSPVFEFTVYRFDRSTGEETEIGRFRNKERWDVRELSRGKGDKVVIGLRGTPDVWIVDPDAEAPDKRIRYIRLTSRLKGVHFAKDDTELQWFNCYTYEQRVMDLSTGETRLGYYTSGGHAGGGGGKTLRHYAGLVIVQPSGLTDWKAGDKVRVFADFKPSFWSDYGQLVDLDARWWLCNGTRGDVANQHIMVDGEDCATILRLCGYNTSRNTWATNTYSTESPDVTKVAWASDQLGDGDVHYVVARRPDAPADLKVASDKIGVLHFTWKPSRRTSELAGYVIYGMDGDGMFRPLHDELLSGEAAVLKVAPERASKLKAFAIVAREHSGLESLPLATGGPLHLSVWDGHRSKTARVLFDGNAWGSRAVRHFVAEPGEKDFTATVTWNEALPDGEIKAFVRARPDDNKWAGWQWRDGGDMVEAGDGKVVLTVPAGLVVDKVIVTPDADYKPAAVDDRFAAPAAVSEAKTTVDKEGVVTLRWSKPAGIDYWRVDIYAGDRADFEPSNETAVGTVLAGQEQQFVDWGLKPGRRIYYKLVPVSTQWVRGEAEVVTVDVPAVEKLVTLEAEGPAELPAGIERVEQGGLSFLSPKPIEPTKKAEMDKMIPVKFSFKAPVAGRYQVWCRYMPGYTPRLDVPAAIDDAEPGRWTVNPPYRPMSRMFNPPKGERLVFSERVTPDYQQIFDLSAGRHELTIWLDPAQPGGNVHAVGQVWVTNDPSWRPEGFDPRANFAKRR